MKNKRYRVFWVDDDRFFVKLYLDELQKEFLVLFHNNAEDAIRSIVEDASLDAVILDVMMDPPLIAPLADTGQGFSTGVWILKQIRNHLEAHRLPVCILTNRDPGTIREEIGDQSWPKGLLLVQSKDISPEKLRLMLRDMIEASEHISPE